jgi:pimeloyl-ACP methyl ester carboxylesterase
MTSRRLIPARSGARACASGCIIDSDPPAQPTPIPWFIAPTTGNPLATRRTLAELKTEIDRRARGDLAPITGVPYEDACAVIATVADLERDHWARAWSDRADLHLERAHALESTAPDAAREAFRRAWRVFNFARWPVENTPYKRYVYPRALSAFRNYGRLLEPAIEVVRVPFENQVIVAYLRVPASPRPAPLVLGISGLDSRKEDVAVAADPYLGLGIALLAVDMPGTGEAPIALDRTAERMFSALLDYVSLRPDLDASRVIVQGRSWSGYWAAKLAIVERSRLRGTIVHGGPIDRYFAADWLKASLDTPEYLYDYFPAKAALFGASTVEDMLERAAMYSLAAQGILDEPSAPMLVVNGALDSQIPVDDIFVLLRHGSPKETWINPAGGHMGRSREWPSHRIRDEVIAPWITRRLGLAAVAGGTGAMDCGIRTERDTSSR